MSIMELSPYLKAIQEVPGSTPGEKYRALNSIGHKILQSRNIKKALETAKVPTELKPLVQVEIARKLRQSSMILEALKSENVEVVNRALKARWFFNGGNDMTSILFYQTQLFPFVSVQSRKRIIRALAGNLIEEPVLADQFYDLVTLMYGERQARPLLKACSESYIWGRIQNLQLNNYTVHFLYNKYPELVIKYLKLTSSHPESEFASYGRFLPCLLKNHPKVFEELFDPSAVPVLSGKHTALFLKNCRDAFLKNPGRFISVLRPSVLKIRLTEDQRESIFKVLVDAKVADFKSSFTGKHFGFLDDGKKLSILLSAFRKLNLFDYLDNHHNITPQILRILPKEQRIEIAKAKYEDETYPGDKLNINYKRSWMTYLDCSESLQYYKAEMEVVEECDQYEVIKRMIYTCEVNKDSEALLDVLKYIDKKFKNSNTEFWIDILRFSSRHFNFAELFHDHWEIISEFMMKIIEKDEKYDDLCIEEFMTEQVRWDITNPVHQISPFLMYIFKHYRDILLSLVPSFAKISLEKLIEGIPSMFNDINDLEIDQVIDIIQAIGNFNSKSADTVSIKDFPWLAATVKKFLVDRHGEWKDVKRLQLVLRDTERDLFEAYIPEKHRYIDFKSSDALRNLKRDPELVNRTWKGHWDKCLGNITKGNVKKFIKKLRWYQDLPIKFAEKSLKDIKKQERGLVLLAHLLEGPAFERLVTSLDMKSSFIPQAIKCVSPPVSLDFALKFCEEANLKEMGESLVVVGRKTSVAKVIPFAMALMNQQPVKKYAIKLYCLAFSFDCTK